MKVKTLKGEKSMNVRLLRRVKKHILEEPRRLDMDTYGDKVDKKRSPCGTTACIAGWALLLSLKTTDVDKLPECEIADNEAKRLLQLDEGDAQRLFFVGNWPSNFEEKYVHASTYKKKAKVTAERIECFIAEQK